MNTSYQSHKHGFKTEIYHSYKLVAVAEEVEPDYEAALDCEVVVPGCEQAVPDCAEVLEPD